MVLLSKTMIFKQKHWFYLIKPMICMQNIVRVPKKQKKTSQGGPKHCEGTKKTQKNNFPGLMEPSLSAPSVVQNTVRVPKNQKKPSQGGPKHCEGTKKTKKTNFQASWSPASSEVTGWVP